MGRRPCCSKELVLNRGAWTAMEDKILSDYILAHGEGKWRHLPERAGLKRCGKSCRLRWLNYLRPGIKRGSISEEEEDLIIRLHKLLGNRWALIAGRLPGRTDNEIKNYWHTKLSKNGANSSNNNNKPNNSGSSDQSNPNSQDRPVSEEPNLAKKRRLCEPQTNHVVRTTARRFTKPVTVVPQVEEEEDNDDDEEEEDEENGDRSEVFNEPLEGLLEDCQVLVSNFEMDFDVDQSFLSDFFNATADWISEPPSSDLEGNVSYSKSDQTFLVSNSNETLVRAGSDLESMASLIETDDHLDSWFLI